MRSSSNLSKERSQLVQYRLAEDTVLPRFKARVIVESENAFKSKKQSALANMGIKPPRPRKKQLDDVEEPEHVNGVTLMKDTPEIPSRYHTRFGTSLNIQQLKVDIESFQQEGRNFMDAFNTLKTTQDASK